MVRFVFNFIFFGILFYAIWLFFPDAFHTLVSWAGNVYTFLVDCAVAIIDWISDLTKPSGASENGAGAILPLLILPRLLKK